MRNDTMSSAQPMQSYTDESRVCLLISTTVAFLSFTFIFVALRVYVRAVALKKWGVDDTFLVISYVLTFLTGAVFTICTRYGLGQHIWMVPVDIQQTGRKQQVITGATLGYHISFIVIKMAILLQLRRVFPLPNFCLICDIMFGFICCFGIAVVVSSIVMAAPTWQGDTFAGERYDQGTWWLGTAIVHLITDIVIFFMPIPLLRGLRLKKMQKFALMVTFGFGLITTAISLIRIAAIKLAFSRDTTWSVIPSLVWSMAELCCAVICACIPTLRPLLRVMRRNSDDQKVWSRPYSNESDIAQFARKPLKATAVSSEQSLTNPRCLDVELGTHTKEQFTSGDILTRIASSPALTATVGESDDGSEGLGPVDEEVATPLSPPPKVFARV
ncbi:uncharacterized protein CTRU02_203054 [Colletotrichum truncatum]|uniref:Integral membrane protein n=1 Tax=Colletotrichum truncatum TaxID=5467 RepID=A0ACC3Z868_COLTU|nr:uncharacterized protein CTRU02_13126 [Colletotrichum truncatum]XP_036580927.1 uncharacterized protein CTRU02_08892 [Colletotrichum truncatum]KAF6783618.1 integral membrane protein [Colletotrichum truncatum]KAF6789100.1 integral membrane protein [Colletotrichum truncatum]